jgi:hypothetical protein
VKFHNIKPGHTLVSQIGGEEVAVVIPNDRFQELFGIEVK